MAEKVLFKIEARPVLSASGCIFSKMLLYCTNCSPNYVQDVSWDKRGVVAYGKLSDVADALAGLTYEAQSNEFYTTDSIEIEVIDAGGLAAIHTINVDIDASSPPEIERVGALALLPWYLRIDEDSDLLIDALKVGVPNSAADLIVQVEIFCTNGFLSVPSAAKNAALSLTREGAGTLIIAGPINGINRALRSLTYSPNTDVWGSDELSVVARKGIKGKAGVWDSGAGRESIIVLIDPVNDPPTIDLPLELADKVPPMARMGEALALADIQVRDVDAAELAGSELISINISTGDLGNMVALARSSVTVQGRLPGVRFIEGSAEGAYPIMAFKARIDYANVALGLLNFLPSFGGSSGVDTVTITVSDNGNWGEGSEEIVVANVTIEVEPLADGEALVQWSTPLESLTLDEDCRLDIVGISLVPKVADSVSNSTVVDAVFSVAHGVVRIGKSALISDENIFRGGQGSLTFSGTISDVSAALKHWMYFPEPNYHGLETLRLSVRGRHGEWETNASVPMVVLSQPDAPSVTVTNATKSRDDYTVDVGTRLSLHGIVVEHADDLYPNQGVTMTLRVHSNASHGSLTVDEPQQGLRMYIEEPTGVLVMRGRAYHLQVALDSGALVYAPAAGYDGVDVVTLKVSADSPMGDFGVKGSWIPPEKGTQTEAKLEILVVPTLITAAVVLRDGARFCTLEDSAVKITGIEARAPGRWNTSETVVTVRLFTNQGSVTLPGASGRPVEAQGQGESTMQITGKEYDVNIALIGALFKSAPFYNGVAEIKVRCATKL